MLHILVEHVHIFRSPTSGIVTFWHVPFGALDETEHIRRVYFNSGESEKESMTVKQYLISDICKYFLMMFMESELIELLTCVDWHTKVIRARACYWVSKVIWIYDTIWNVTFFFRGVCVNQALITFHRRF